jgi:hypothetical protein
MTTRSWSALYDHSNDAGFRAWVADFGNYCDQIGLPRHTDTGQINAATVTRPATNTAAGYEIRKLEDAGLPTLYIKLEYGTHSGATLPATWASVGTGTNGAGTLTGLVTDRALLCRGITPTAGTTQSYFCRLPGFVGLIFHSGGQPSTGNGASLIVCRTCDASGVPTATGFVVYYGGGSTTYTPASVQAVRTSAPTEVFPRDINGNFTLTLHGLTVQVEGQNPLYRHQMPTPLPAPVFGVCTYVGAHIADHTTFTATLVGSTPRTFMALGARTNFVGGPQSAATWVPAMLWE